MPGFNIIPLTGNNLNWLQSHPIRVPPITADSRFPTVAELQHAVGVVENFQVAAGPPSSDAPWPIVLHRPDDARLTTVIKVTPLTDINEPHGFWFEQGWPPLVVALAQFLATSTGPLGILAIEDGSATIVEATSDIGTVLQSWPRSRTGG